MKRISLLLTIIALILSHIMCFVVAWNYRDMLCGIEHSGFSAPADVAFLAAIPYAVGIMICGILAYILRRKAK